VIFILLLNFVIHDLNWTVRQKFIPSGHSSLSYRFTLNEFKGFVPGKKAGMRGRRPFNDEFFRALFLKRTKKSHAMMRTSR
jgi:hypothetical protein